MNRISSFVALPMNGTVRTISAMFPNLNARPSADTPHESDMRGKGMRARWENSCTVRSISGKKDLSHSVSLLPLRKDFSLAILVCMEKARRKIIDTKAVAHISTPLSLCVPIRIFIIYFPVRNL